MQNEPYHENTRLRIAATAIPLLALIGCFARWLLTNVHDEPLGVVAAAALVFLFAVLGVRFIPDWMRAWSGTPEDSTPIIGKRSGRRSRMHPFLKIVLAVLLTRVLLCIAAYAITTVQSGYAGGILDALEIWNPGGTDTRHYLSIAEHWYQTEGDAKWLLVFYPFYPIIVRMFSLLFGNYLIAGLFVSNAMFLFSGYLLYELALLDMDRQTALRAVKYLCILPASCLFVAPMSDSLFLFLTVSCVYLARKKQYLFASVIGFFASFTRVPGLLLLAPVCFELIADTVRTSKQGLPDSQYIWKTVGRFASLLLIPLGFGLYLFINFRVTGDWFRFLTYQKEHWFQSMGWFFNTAEYQISYALSAAKNGDTTLYGLWLPNLVHLFGALCILIGAQKKLRASHVAYFIIYYAVTMGATWLLSAPRYLTAAYPLALGLATITEKHWADRLATLLCLIGLALYLYAYLRHWSVY